MPSIKNPVKVKIVKADPALRLDHAVAYCVLADHDGGELSPDIAPYWRAFKSEFAPGTPFTLYCPYTNQVLLYVYEKNTNVRGIPRELFNKKCRTIAGRLLKIADSLVRLEKRDCVSLEYRGLKRVTLPPDWGVNWRRYTGLFPDESEALVYVMSCAIEPKPGLFRLAGKQGVEEGGLERVCCFQH